MLLGSGMALIAAAFGSLRRTGQDRKPRESTPEIISTGVCRFIRNPMHVSMGPLQAGIGVALEGPVRKDSARGCVAYQSTGQDAGGFAVFTDGLTGHQRHPIAIHPLYQPFPAGGKVE